MKGGTQNVNECLHSVIWHKVPKEIFVSKPRLELGIVHAIAEFNFGQKAAFQILKKSMGQEVPNISRIHAEKKDKDRIEGSEKGASKFVRQQRRKKNAEKEKQFLVEEGPTYQAGGF